MNALELRNSILKQLNRITAQPEKIGFDPGYVQLESQETIIQLNKILAQFSQETSYKECLVKLQSFLAQRWHKILNNQSRKNAIYYVNPYTHANKICLAIASIVSKELEIHEYELIMPTLKHQSHYPDFRQSILSDDATKLIDVEACLKKVKLHGTIKLCDHNNELLSPTEAQRVMKFLPTMGLFFKAIQENNHNKSERLFNKIKKQLGFSLPNSQYDDTDAYSRKLTALEDIQQIENLVKSLQSLPRASWREFIKQINYKDLEKSLNASNFAVSIANRDHYRHDQAEHNRVVLFLFAHLYSLQREERGTFTGWWGKITGLAETKESKLNTVNNIIDFLTSDKPLNEYTQNMGTAVSAGRVRLLDKQIKNVIDPNYFNATPTWGARWGISRS